MVSDVPRERAICGVVLEPEEKERFLGQAKDQARSLSAHLRLLILRGECAEESQREREVAAHTYKLGKRVAL